jgi:hypothetical protein
MAQDIKIIPLALPAFDVDAIATEVDEFLAARGLERGTPAALMAIIMRQVELEEALHRQIVYYAKLFGDAPEATPDQS